MDSRAQSQEPWLRGLVAAVYVNPPAPAMEPTSSALVDRLSSTAPPGKSKIFIGRADCKINIEQYYTEGLVLEHPLLGLSGLT